MQKYIIYKTACAQINSHLVCSVLDVAYLFLDLLENFSVAHGRLAYKKACEF